MLTTTVKGCEPVPGVEALSVAVTVNGKEPAVLGIPESDPSLPTVIPGGGTPLVTAQVNGGVPPLATVKV